LNTLRANFSFSLLVPAHQGLMYRGGSIGYLPEISDSRIFGLPSFLSMLDMGAFHYSLLVPVNETLMHRTRRTDSRTRFRT
jgi:hypothetical protein